MADQLAECQNRLGCFLTTSPLYRPVDIPFNFAGEPPLEGYLPPTVSQACETCGQETNWAKKSRHTDEYSGRFARVAYTCRNCDKQHLNVWMFWWVADEGITRFIKVGQHPELQIRPPKDVEKALGPHAYLYRKGLTSRHHGYGIGALAYFRRLIEDTTDDMLDVLIEALQDEEGADPALIEQIKKAKEGKSFEDKVRYAVNVLPPHLRPSGIDPFALLFDVYSEDLHSSSEEECLETADAMRDVLDIIFRQLKTQVKERKVAAEKLKALQARHAQPKRGAPQ